MNTVPVEGKRDYWPQLRIQDPGWKKIFGKGENWKINLWFCVPGIWEARQYAFFPEIDLWHEDHGNDWQFAKSKLPVWLGTLKSHGFKWDVYQTWNKTRENTPAGEIQGEPKRIAASKDGDSVILNQSQLQSEDDLINVLVNVIKQYAKIVESLRS